MKNKKVIIIFIFLILLLFCTTSFATTTEIQTYCPNCLIMEMSTGKVIFEKNGYTPVPPASTTKIMTAILTLEHCKLTDTAKVSNNAIVSVPATYTTAYLVEGEILTIEQLLYALLIPSANDAANVLAEHIAGSISNFSSMMNAKAKEIGCKNTHFVNPNGVTAENHYSTAYDLALMGRYAMQNETFRKIVSTTSYTLPATNMFPEATRFFYNSNPLLRPDNRNSLDNYYYKYTTGIKTGYTDAAGRCIVASAKKDDKEYIVAILGGEETEDGLSERNLDCITLFNYAFDNYTIKTVNDANSILEKITIPNASFSTRDLKVVVKDDITLIIKNNTNISSIIPEINITSQLKAPIAKDTVIGKITYTIDGNTYSSDLLAGSDIEEIDMVIEIIRITSILILTVLLKALFPKRKINKKA